MKSGTYGKNTSLKDRSLSNLLSMFLSVSVVTVLSLPAAVAQEEQEQEQEQQEVPQEEIQKYEELKEAAKKDRIDQVVEQDQTGNDPRVFSNKWMPFYRYQELENGLTQQDLTAFGTVAFNPTVGMFYELPLAQYRDFSDVPGVPPTLRLRRLAWGTRVSSFW